MKELQKVKEALEYYSKIPSQDDGYEEWYEDEGKVAKQALTELNAFMERLDMRKKTLAAIRELRKRKGKSVTSQAINVIKEQS